MWVSLCLDLNSTTFLEGCLESVVCDKLLIIFSTPRKLTRLGDVTLPGPEAGPEACSPALSRLGPLGDPQLCRALWPVRRWTGPGPHLGGRWPPAKLTSSVKKLINGSPRPQARGGPSF